MFLLTDAPVCKLLFLKFDVWIIQVVWASCHLNFRGNRLVWSLDDEKGRRWREERRFPRSLIHQKSLCHVLISWHLFTTYTILFIFNKKKERDRQIDTERKRESDKVRDRMKHERQKSVFYLLLFCCSCAERRPTSDSLLHSLLFLSVRLSVSKTLEGFESCRVVFFSPLVFLKTRFWRQSWVISTEAHCWQENFKVMVSLPV